MIAHLQDGAFQGRQILQPATAQMMHARQFGLNPDMNGICLGFYEDSRDGHRIIGHDGDTIYFHSRLRLIPDAGVGFFLSFNSAGLGISNDREQIFQKFVDRYFPFTPPNPPAISTAVADAKTLSGSYLNTRRSESNFLAVLNVISPLSVSALPGGDLQVSGIDGFNHQPLKFREVRPRFYDNVGGQSHLSFQPDPNEAGRLLLVTDIPVFVFQRVPWYRGATFGPALLIFTVGILLLALILWPVAAMLRRHYGRPLSLSPGARNLRLLVKLFVLIDVLVLVAWGVLLSYGAKHLIVFTAHFDPWFRVTQFFTAMGLFGVLFAVIYAVTAWKERILWRIGALGETILAAAFIGYGWIVFAAHLLSFHLRY